MGVSPDDMRRISAKIVNLLNIGSNNEGHTCLPKEKLILHVSKALEQDTEKVEEALDSLVKAKRVVIDTIDGLEMVFYMDFLSAKGISQKKLSQW